MTNSSNLPKHVAIIMDGNRRWARQNKLQIFKGHEKVAQENIENLTEHCIQLGIPYLTLWAFSTENWQRDQVEVEAILNLMRRSFSAGFDRLLEKKVRVKTIGNLSKFPQDIQQSIEHIKQQNLKDFKITVTFALNYGGRDEILRAVKKMIHKKSLNSDQKNSFIKIEDFDQYLDTHNLPDPDLIIRTGGEQRLSGFMPWQSVYAELYFTKVLMPDFGVSWLNEALKEYNQRIRRFGK